VFPHCFAANQCFFGEEDFDADTQFAFMVRAKWLE